MTLLDYLTKYDLSEYAFSQETGIARSTINSICNGGGANVDTAAIIVEATEGEVDYKDLRSEKKRRAS